MYSGAKTLTANLDKRKFSFKTIVHLKLNRKQSFQQQLVYIVFISKEHFHFLNIQDKGIKDALRENLSKELSPIMINFLK